MNVIILDKDMKLSAAMLDDSNLLAQIDDATQILMDNYNHSVFPDSNIVNISDSINIFYRSQRCELELFNYMSKLLEEYSFRFRKDHQCYFWWLGFCGVIYGEKRIRELRKFHYSKAFLDGDMIDDIEAVQKYISTKLMKKQPTWTNREKPDWWEV